MHTNELQCVGILGTDEDQKPDTVDLLGTGLMDSASMRELTSNSVYLPSQYASVSVSLCVLPFSRCVTVFLWIAFLVSLCIPLSERLCVYVSLCIPPLSLSLSLCVLLLSMSLHASTCCFSYWPAQV